MLYMIMTSLGKILIKHRLPVRWLGLGSGLGLGLGLGSGLGSGLGLGLGLGFLVRL